MNYSITADEEVIDFDFLNFQNDYGRPEGDGETGDDTASEDVQKIERIFREATQFI